MTSIDPRDRPELGGSPEGEPPSDIEITPEMMDAALDVWRLYDPVEDPCGPIIRAVYSAMIAARPLSRPPSHPGLPVQARP